MPCRWLALVSLIVASSLAPRGDELPRQDPPSLVASDSVDADDLGDDDLILPPEAAAPAAALPLPRAASPAPARSCWRPDDPFRPPRPAS